MKNGNKKYLKGVVIVIIVLIILYFLTRSGKGKKETP
jgi:hypothetical protein